MSFFKCSAILIALSVFFTACQSPKQEEPQEIVIENPKFQSVKPEAEIKQEEPKETKQEEVKQEDKKEEPQKEEKTLASKDNKAKSEETKALLEKAASMQTYSTSQEDAPIIEKQDDNILLLVNKFHPLAKNYKPDDMQEISKCVEGIGTKETHQMRKVAADALLELFEGAEKDGFDIRLRTGYRSYSYQNTLYSNYVKNNGQEEADRYSAKPGKSEHQTGLCCDVGVNGVSLTGFNTTKEAAWVYQHAHEYGFILRYPKDKEKETGYMYESWHIRYVGKEIATEIWEQGLCLEEYMGILN